MDGLYEKHVLHSLSIAKACGFEPGTSVIDIGTGGGFPGIPLAIYFPETRFHLVDATAKKIKVVNAVIDALGLTHASAAQARVEAITEGAFTWAVSRAVAPLKTLIAWSRPLIRKTGGKPGARGLLCLKGGDLSAEIRESGYRPRLYEIGHFYEESWFRDKYILEIPLG